MNTRGFFDVHHVIVEPHVGHMEIPAVAQDIGGPFLKKVDVLIHVTNAIDGERVMDRCQGVIY